MSAPDILPDSRLQDRNFGAVMGDFELPNGQTVRLEMTPVFCASCGTLYGYVPRDNTNFVCWLCRPCFEKYGETASLCTVPEDEFNQLVAEEMVARFGRPLTDAELSAAAEQGKLGRALELLDRESPYAIPDRRPRE